MVKEFKEGFFQTFSIVMVCLLIIMSVMLKNGDMPLSFNWNLVLISGIFATIFGIMYPLLWNHSSLKAQYKILISSLGNLGGGTLCVWLFSAEMFSNIVVMLPLMIIGELIGHSIAFYFYSKSDNDKASKELNKLLKK